LAQADNAELLSRSQQLLDAAQPALAETLQVAKRLYVAGEHFESRRLERRARALARQEAEPLLAAPRIDAGRGKTLARVLKGLNEHPLARQILSRIRQQDPEDIRAAQQLALNTYKDEELPPDARLAAALKVLEEIGLREPGCSDPETLGQGGAVYKRAWERSGQIEDLRAALHFYQSGWSRNKQDDMGYCGVNAAYILDLLAHRARIAAARETISERHADELAREARALREEMKRSLPAIADGKARVAQERKAPEEDPTSQWWYLVTMAEVAFGLGDWEEAAGWLARARVVEHDEWERQTTAKQLVSLARMRGFLPPADESPPQDWQAPWRALHALLGEDARATFDSHRGKVGLALSGGGLRASLFHLGVLARLAECDALRGVEVLSTVSGGSIVGAHYYLALRRRLQSVTDDKLSRAEYLEIVREVMDQFCAGVHKNLRVRALTSLRANLKMLFTRTYGRSNRMGELYEEHLYDAVKDGHAPGELRKLHELLVFPLMPRRAGSSAAERDDGFKPKYSNWRRRAKVPILLLNATSLNSGHNWHFTASWMGEPPGLTGQEVDMNERYRRLYYWQAPTPELRDCRLGYAVAASAGVPALFDPLVLKGLYPGRTVKLVDGGVHDNQGVAGLLDEGCSLILCSDASGQMDDQDSPASGALGVFFRSNGVLQDRLREAQYQDVAMRTASNALQGLFFVHLKQQLQTDPIDWVDCQDPGQPTSRPNCTPYEVDRKIQRLLSEVRTDLDSFTEVEAAALMGSGYLMTEYQLRELDKTHRASGMKGNWGGFDVNAPRLGDWPFARLLPVLAADPDGSDRRARDLARQLEVSRRLFGKVWALVPGLTATAVAIAAAALILGGLWIYEHWTAVYPLTIEIGVAKVSLAVALLLAGMLVPLTRFLRVRSAGQSALFMVIAATLGWIATNLHLWTFDRIFKRRGRLDRLMRLPGS
jgi:predicted acylesterase/phospholipase RssA